MTKLFNILAMLLLGFGMLFNFTSPEEKNIQQDIETVYQASIGQIDNVETLLDMDSYSFWIYAVVFVLVIVLRLVPTAKDYDIIHLVIRILNFLIPNRATGPPERFPAGTKARFSIGKIFKTKS